jgi:hypothetical protein
MTRLQSVARVGLLGLSVGLAVPLLTARSSAQAQAPHGIPIGAARVIVSQADMDDGRLLRAFVPTGSTNENILCTLAENEPGWSGAQLAGLTVMCRPREWEGQEGIGIAVFFPFEPTTDEMVLENNGEFRIHLTVFQEGARGYGAPVSCPGEC